MDSSRRSSWIEQQAAVGVRFVRGGRVVSYLELGVREDLCSERLRDAVLQRLFQLRVQLVRWERAVEDSVDLHRLTLVEFDGGSLEANRRGSIASELRRLVLDLVGAGRVAQVSPTRQGTVTSLRVGVAAA